MSMTQADWAALQQAANEGGTAYLEGLAGQTGAPSIPGDPNSAATTTTLQDTSASNQDIQQILAQAWSDYQNNPNLYNQAVMNLPQYAWMMSNPELAPILIAAGENKLNSEGIQAALQETNWWKTNGQAARQWTQLNATDPETAHQQVQIGRNTIIAEANSLGVQLSDSTITGLATMAAQFGWDSNTIQQAVANAYNPQTNINIGGTSGNFYDQATQLQEQYAVPLGDQSIKQWTQMAVSGKADISGFENYLRTQAQTLFPFMKQSLSMGVTPQQWFAPYTSAASSLLGVSPDTINWSDHKWLGALLSPSDDGSQAPVNLTQFQKTLRTDPQFGWSKTADAVAAAYSTAHQITQTFGKVA